LYRLGVECGFIEGSVGELGEASGGQEASHNSGLLECLTTGLHLIFLLED
jgi:hypothetical protein